MLLLERGHHGHHGFDKPGPLSTLRAKAALAPLHTRSKDGSRFVESMMTVVATLKQQKRNVLEYLTAAHEAALRGEATPSLLPAGEMESQAAA